MLEANGLRVIRPGSSKCRVQDSCFFFWQLAASPYFEISRFARDVSLRSLYVSYPEISQSKQACRHNPRKEILTRTEKIRCFGLHMRAYLLGLVHAPGVLGGGRFGFQAASCFPLSLTSRASPQTWQTRWKRARDLAFCPCSAHRAIWTG